MPDETTILQLQTVSTPKGIEVLAITAGIGNGWIFNPEVLQASQPLWDKAECYTDHTPGNHSVRDLGGILSNPQWDQVAQGIRAVLTPAGPAAQVVRDLAEAAFAHPALPIGMSADILMRVDKTTVLEIVKVKSLDVVMYPARGGKFVRVLQSVGAGLVPAQYVHSKQGENIMSEETTTTSSPLNAAHLGEMAEGQRGLVDTPVASKLKEMEANNAALSAFLGEQARQAKLQEQIAISDTLLAEQCKYVLNSALGASRLPEVTQARIRKSFEGTVFQPAQLQAAIEEAQAEVSTLTGSLSVQGPSRIHGMFSNEDQLQAAFDDLLGAPRDVDKVGLKVTRLSGIREAYLMLTGDYDLHGGYEPIRAQFATTAGGHANLLTTALGTEGL